MNLKVGIVGLPNVGKSTLFNALLKKEVANTANYPFCTIEPNKGIVAVPDQRLSILAEIVNSQNIVPAAVEFIDIAGLVKGAAQGQGLGNKFLSHIREVQVICHVLRFFNDSDITHVENRIDPLSDLETINAELILADLETLEKQKQPKGKVEKEDLIFWQAVTILKEHLEKGTLAKDVPLTNDQKNLSKKLHLITAKPAIYVANTDEQNLLDTSIFSSFSHSPLIPLSAKFESELASLTEPDQKEYLSQYNLKTPGLERLTQTAYKTLNLISFLTAGEQEVRAWTIEKDTLAPDAAAVIHTDFKTHFIKAKVATYQDFTTHKGWKNLKEKGLIRDEGKDYPVKEGDIIEFMVNA